MRIKIITDSTCDLEKRYEENDNLVIIPLTVHFEDETYVDRKDLTTEELMEKVKEKKCLPTTSQPSPGAFIEVMQKVVDNGDDIIGIFISEHLSGTYQGAINAKNSIDTDKRIECISSSTVSRATGYLVEYALELLEMGKSYDEIISLVNEKKENNYGVTIFEDLTHLKYGGRISGVQSLVASVVGVKVILEIKDGKLLPYGKIRTKKKFSSLMKKYFEENNLLGKDLDVVTLGVEKDSKEVMEYLKEVTPLINVKKVVNGKGGIVIGTHSGPEACAIFFFNA